MNLPILQTKNDIPTLSKSKSITATEKEEDICSYCMHQKSLFV